MFLILRLRTHLSGDCLYTRRLLLCIVTNRKERTSENPASGLAGTLLPLGIFKPAQPRLCAILLPSRVLNYRVKWMHARP